MKETFVCLLPPPTRRQEVDAAQAGAAAERAARADAEAALSEARASLRHTNEWLQESLANGPTAALAALLEEKEAAKMAAAQAVEEAAAGTRALENNRGEEVSLLTIQRDEVRGRGSTCFMYGQEILTLPDETFFPSNRVSIVGASSRGPPRLLPSSQKRSRQSSLYPLFQLAREPPSALVSCLHPSYLSPHTPRCTACRHDTTRRLERTSTAPRTRRESFEPR